MEISYWPFFALFWLTCGVIGYSMWCGIWHRKFNESFTLWCFKYGYDFWKGLGLMAISGPFVIWVVLVMRKWTEKDGMWL